MSEAVAEGCVQLPGHHYYACIVPSGFLYWSNGAFTNTFYLHPYEPGDATVISGYFKDSAPGQVPGPQWTKRFIALATGVIVVGWNITVADVAPPPPTMGVDWTTGQVRPLTAAEQKSVLDYWARAQEVPGNDW